MYTFIHFRWKLLEIHRFKYKLGHFSWKYGCNTIRPQVKKHDLIWSQSHSKISYFFNWCLICILKIYSTFFLIYIPAKITWTLYWRFLAFISEYFFENVCNGPTFTCIHTRGTPRVQFANIRKMVLCQGLPHCLRLCVDPCMARHAQSLNSSLHAWLQNLEAF